MNITNLTFPNTTDETISCAETFNRGLEQGVAKIEYWVDVLFYAMVIYIILNAIMNRMDEDSDFYFVVDVLQHGAFTASFVVAFIMKYIMMGFPVLGS